MKNEKLQHSEALLKHFANYREEAPLLSAPEIEKLFADRAVLPNPSHIYLRRIIMTLSGITGLGIAAYFAFFSNDSQGIHGTHRTDQSYGTYSLHVAPDSNTTSHLALPATAPEKPSLKPSAKPTPRGPWSAGNDQIYANLTPEELARLGIMVLGDTVVAYKLPPNDTVESMHLTAHSIGGGKAETALPLNVYPPHFYPLLMTFSNGNGTAYVIEDNGRTREWGMVGDNSMMKMYRDWLESPGISGFYPLGFRTKSVRPCDDCKEFQTLTLQVAKNFPKPLMPFRVPDMKGFTDTLKHALTQYANFYSGKDTLPSFEWPKNITLKVDTVTTKALIEEMDSEENSASMKHLHSTMARLNELVPVIVRLHGGSGAPDSNDFIFWYEPSDELFAALPPAQAAAFRKKLAEPPHCMNAPEAVTTEAEVTYCVSKEQQVSVRVFDLMGHIVKSETQRAEAGDNIAKINTRTLPSGMYIILVQDQDGGQRTRRIWVQNANPK